MIDELFRYTEANVETDGLHWLMICSCFAAAEAALKEEEFWPPYVEAITRLTLLLLGEYPDHRKRKAGKKKSDHYQLGRLRTLHYLQSEDQKLKVLLAVQAAGFPQLSVPPRTALSEFREANGFDATYRDFMRWYRRTYAEDYALVF
jgi:hypothetical protein